ncbi:hypothetical protein [Amycolatopsis kentuckyensis]|uniref:hypothetical protein n=1 Tax=Amycolatopsis kentuckyensis TaxID=218823 RepID=UPI0035654538
MAERNSWAVSDSPNGVITTEDARLAVSAAVQSGPSPVLSRNGIRPANGDPGKVAAASPTPDATVTVQPFQMFMRASRGVGSYVQTLDAVKTLDLLKDNPAHSSNARIDLIVAQQTDKFYGDTTNGFVVKQIVGDPTTSQEPTPTGDYMLLASVRIPAGAKSIAPEQIQDRRPGWVVGLGGVMPSKGVDDRNGTHSYNGLTTYRQDRRWLEINDGEKWRVPSIPVCTSLADIRAMVTDPLPGQLVFSTQDNLVYRWNGADWIGSVATGGGAIGTTPTATRHEARYEVRGNVQTFPVQANTRSRFPTMVYGSPDVTTSASNDVFTLNRAGIWTITASFRTTAPLGSGEYHTYMAITDGANVEIRYANTMSRWFATSPGTMSTATTNFFNAGATVSVVFWSDSANRTHDTGWANVNHVSLTWLRA